jgi:hypothetical protein
VQISEAETPEEKQEAKAGRAYWRKATVWQLSRHSCLHALAFLCWQYCCSQ